MQQDGLFHLRKIHISEIVFSIVRHRIPFNPRRPTRRLAPFSHVYCMNDLCVVAIVVTEDEVDVGEVEEEVNCHLQLSTAGQKNLRARCRAVDRRETRI